MPSHLFFRAGEVEAGTQANILAYHAQDRFCVLPGVLQTLFVFSSLSFSLPLREKQKKNGANINPCSARNV